MAKITSNSHRNIHTWQEIGGAESKRGCGSVEFVHHYWTRN